MATKYWDSIQSLTLRLTIHGEALDGKVWKEVLPVEAILDTKAQKTTFKRIGNYSGVFTLEMTKV